MLDIKNSRVSWAAMAEIGCRYELFHVFPNVDFHAFDLISVFTFYLYGVTDLTHLVRINQRSLSNESTNCLHIETFVMNSIS